mmetsp:Transcript_66654/g.216917  ORF Transcript_66654/g.216917 Transcript_66654/m.216917 type:complete len:117 (+) Transcript_66654:2347-2697(+)
MPSVVMLLSGLQPPLLLCARELCPAGSLCCFMVKGNGKEHRELFKWPRCSLWTPTPRSMYDSLAELRGEVPTDQEGIATARDPAAFGKSSSSRLSAWRSCYSLQGTCSAWARGPLR